MLALKEQAKQGVHVQSVDLRPLGAPQVAEFVADALQQDVATATPLAEIIAQKTGGNPFFMRQFLQALYDSKLVFVRRARRRRVSLRRGGGQKRRRSRRTWPSSSRRSSRSCRARRATCCASRRRSAIASSYACSPASTNAPPRETADALAPRHRRRGLIAPLSGLESARSRRARVAARLRPLRVPARSHSAGRVCHACPPPTSPRCISRSAVCCSPARRPRSSRAGSSTSSTI